MLVSQKVLSLREASCKKSDLYLLDANLLEVCPEKEIRVFEFEPQYPVVSQIGHDAEEQNLEPYHLVLEKKAVLVPQVSLQEEPPGQ